MKLTTAFLFILTWLIMLYAYVIMSAKIDRTENQYYYLLQRLSIETDFPVVHIGRGR
jgi:hypothetical protein